MHTAGLLPIRASNGGPKDKEAMSAHTNAAAKTAPSTLILFLREGQAGVAVLTLNDPETRNSLSEATCWKRWATH